MPVCDDKMMSGVDQDDCRGRQYCLEDDWNYPHPGQDEELEAVMTIIMMKDTKKLLNTIV